MIDVRESEIQAMKNIVDKCVGIPRFTYEMQTPDAPRPKGEYAAIKCLSSMNPGYDEVRMEEEGGRLFQKTVGLRVLSFAIVFSRVGDEYIKFDNSFYRPDVLALLRQVGFAALAKSPLDLASVVLETNWEFRQAIKMQFNVLREERFEIDEMSGAHVAGSFIDGNQVIHSKGT